MKEDITSLLIGGGKHIWECPEGHRIVQSSPFTVSASDIDSNLFTTNPICQHCLVESLNNKFPITDLGKAT